MPVWAIFAFIVSLIYGLFSAYLGGKSMRLHSMATDARYGDSKEDLEKYRKLDREGDRHECFALIFMVLAIATVFASLVSIAVYTSRWDEDHKLYCESYAGAVYSKSGDACYYRGKDISPWKEETEYNYVEDSDING